MIQTHIDLADARKLFLQNQLQTQHVSHFQFLEAFKKVPREFFLDPTSSHYAYLDADIYIPSQRISLSSKKIAKLFSACDFETRPKVLIIGYAMGYSLAIAYELQAKVYGIEQDSLLHSYGQTSLQHYFDTFYGRTNLDDCMLFEQKPHHEGLPDHGPFDIIMIEGSIETIPENLRAQLRTHGKIVYISKSPLKGIVQMKKNGDANIYDFEASFTLPGFEKMKAFEF